MWSSVYEAHLEKAKLLIDHQKYALAEQELHQLLASNPEDGEAHRLLGLCFLKTGRYAEAFNAVTQAIALNAESDYNHRLLSLVYERENKLPQAEAAARQAIALNPEYAFGYSLLGRILFNQKRLNEALEVVQTGLLYDPEDVECLNLQARIFVRQGNPEKAEANFTSSLKQDPENHYTHTNRAIALAETGKFEQAIIHFKEAIRLNPNYELAKRYLLGTYKSQFSFYRFVVYLFVKLPTQKVSKNWLLVFGAWLMFKVSPAVLPFYLIALHFNLFAEVVFNFIVSLNPETRTLLLKEEKAQIKFLGGLVFLISGTFCLGYFTETATLVNLSYILLCFSVPLVSSFYLQTQESMKNSFLFMYYLALLAILYLVLSYFFPQNNPHAGLPQATLMLFNLGLLAYCWFRKKL